MGYKTIYPKQPTVKGTLSREVLASRAVDEGYCVRPIDASDYDILSAAVLLKSKETIQFCLDLRISPFYWGGSCVLNLISFENSSQLDSPGATELLEVFIQRRKHGYFRPLQPE